MMLLFQRMLGTQTITTPSDRPILPAPYGNFPLSGLPGFHHYSSLEDVIHLTFPLFTRSYEGTKSTFGFYFQTPLFLHFPSALPRTIRLPNPVRQVTSPALY